jgi:RNA polymerase sigma-70 factor (ECF subfamily)
LNDPRLAEEVLQDVMLAAWRNAPRFRGECRLRTWLLTIARNRAINAYHRQVVPDSSVVPLEDPDNAKFLFSSDPPESHPELYAAIASLPDEFRETLELVFFHGLSLAETAHVLGVPDGTVKSRLYRAKERLRLLMKPVKEEHDSAP